MGCLSTAGKLKRKPAFRRVFFFVLKRLTLLCSLLRRLLRSLLCGLLYGLLRGGLLYGLALLCCHGGCELLFLYVDPFTFAHLMLCVTHT